jgi:hypothetical protein
MGWRVFWEGDLFGGGVGVQVRAAFRELRLLMRLWMVGKVVELAPDRVRRYLIDRELRKIETQPKQEDGPDSL